MQGGTDHVTMKQILLVILGFGDALITLTSAASTYRKRVADPLTQACVGAQERLGPTQLDIQPLRNPAIVQENWSKTCWQEPRCVIQPNNAEAVAEVLRIITSLQIPFAVRAGGHSPNPNWSSINSNGILLDLHRLDAITVSEDGASVSVGAGAKWGAVYSALEAKGKAAIGARTRSVGVGGSILGGGYHHLSNQFGLAADNVKNFQAVLSNGSIINANADQNNDLYWGLKGGGPNFGVVTRYDLYTVPVPAVWAQLNVYSPAQVPDLIAAFDKWQANGPPSDAKGNADLIISLDFAVLILVYSEPSAKLPAVFAPFSAIEPIQSPLPPANMTLNQLSLILESANGDAPARHDYRAFSSLINTNLTVEMYEFWRARALVVRQETGASQTFVLQHVSQNLIDIGKRNGGNALGISTSTRQQWWTTLVDWQYEADDGAARSVSIETTSRWQELAAERGLSVPFLFMNDASRDQSPLAAYGGDSLKRLRAISEKYDPMHAFQDLQNGGFLISRAS